MTQANPLPQVIFLSRWLQVPLYLGLISVQAIAMAFIDGLSYTTRPSGAMRRKTD